ncbi:hypothetical protein L6452_02028 [Arctium lappa]|uniref:Uncharacterized protein n=1 Tax=Arctium lappa TaxID=4217 RepID=A0ACB9FIB2_ARCLA|nr:hypothetical protein L6452_02028 [Arctium lappa]
MAQSALVASKNVKFAITDSELPKNNHLARLDFDGVKYPHLKKAAMFLKQSCMAYAVTVDPTPSKALLQQFWFTAEEASITNKKGEQFPAISFITELGSGIITALGLRKALHFPDKPKNGFDALPTDAELIQFLDAMEYAWEHKPRTTIPNKNLTLVKKELMPSQLNYIFSHFIQCMSGKSGSLDQASKTQVQMAYSSKIEKTEKDPKFSYVRFICAYLKFLYPGTYSTNSDASFPKVGQRFLEVKTLPNGVSISELRSRLSILTSSSSAATQEVPSFAIPAATPSKRQSTVSLGPSKKAKFGPIGPEHQSFEESLQFYKMFDNSGPSLATVDTNVNSLSAKVESLAASLTNTTNAVQSAGEALKTLTATCASKADISHIATLQEAIVKVREDSQQQFAALATKATSDLIAFESRLDCLEVEVQVLAAANASSSSKDLFLNDIDKEGEKAAEENTEFKVAAEVQQKETPSQFEGEIAAEKALLLSKI